MRDEKTKRCVFCTASPDGTTSCEIYATRPDQCVWVEAGDAKCQQARELKGLPMLLDKHGQRPNLALMYGSVGEYELDYVPYGDEMVKGGE